MSGPFRLTLLVLLPFAVGVLLWLGGEGNAVTALLLFSEPGLWGLAMWAALVLALDRQWASALALCIGVASMAWALRWSPNPVEPSSLDEEWAESLRGCTVVPDPVTTPVRVLVWTLDPTAPAGDSMVAIVDAHPDILILEGAPGPDVGNELATMLDGESKFIEAPDHSDGIVIVVRGTFEYCAVPYDDWVLEIPDEHGDYFQVVLTFPNVAGAGNVPLLVVRQDLPHSLGGWQSLPGRVDQAASLVAQIANALGSERMVVAGSIGGPRTFSPIDAHMLGARLMPLRTPPTWPSAWGVPPLHALTRVWAGKDWTLEGSQALPSGAQVHAPLLVQLAPN